jgi:hypothetical protein
MMIHIHPQPLQFFRHCFRHSWQPKEASSEVQYPSVEKQEKPHHKLFQDSFIGVIKPLAIRQSDRDEAFLRDLERRKKEEHDNHIRRKKYENELMMDKLRLYSPHQKEKMLRHQTLEVLKTSVEEEALNKRLAAEKALEKATFKKQIKALKATIDKTSIEEAMPTYCADSNFDFGFEDETNEEAPTSMVSLHPTIEVHEAQPLSPYARYKAEIEVLKQELAARKKYQQERLLRLNAPTPFISAFGNRTAEILVYQEYLEALEEEINRKSNLLKLLAQDPLWHRIPKAPNVEDGAKHDARIESLKAQLPEAKRRIEEAEHRLQQYLQEEHPDKTLYPEKYEKRQMAFQYKAAEAWIAYQKCLNDLRDTVRDKEVDEEAAIIRRGVAKPATTLS